MPTSASVPPAAAYYLAPVAYLWMTAVFLLAAGLFVVVYRLCLRGWIRGFGHPLELRWLVGFGALTVGLLINITWLLPPWLPLWDISRLPRDPLFDIPLGFWLLVLIWVGVGILVFVRCWKRHDVAR